jgi:hypothetical protein
MIISKIPKLWKWLIKINGDVGDKVKFKIQKIPMKSGLN